ncbi:hypothetical protein H4219_003132 [Mycoemilia scoparia]|uniref:Uncharacterized protein n=1 Tax=Mycoemilia scoparia TaxID=417184 RepID=A0A9W8A524_9FUNG|nr:hypothetical protein H4219_003132 [Mycoemilia scoparia]
MKSFISDVSNKFTLKLPISAAAIATTSSGIDTKPTDTDKNALDFYDDAVKSLEYISLEDSKENKTQSSEPTSIASTTENGSSKGNENIAQNSESTSIASTPKDKPSKEQKAKPTSDASIINYLFGYASTENKDNPFISKKNTFSEEHKAIIKEQVKIKPKTAYNSGLDKNVVNIVISFTGKYGWGQDYIKNRRYFYIHDPKTKDEDYLTETKSAKSYIKSQQLNNYSMKTVYNLIKEMPGWCSKYPSVKEITILEPRIATPDFINCIAKCLEEYESKCEANSKKRRKPALSIETYEYPKAITTKNQQNGYDGVTANTVIKDLIDELPTNSIERLKIHTITCEYFLTVLSKNQQHLKELEIINLDTNIFDWPYASFAELRKLKIVVYNIPLSTDFTGRMSSSALKIYSSKFPKLQELGLGYTIGENLKDSDGSYGFATYPKGMYDNVLASSWNNVKLVELLYIPDLLEDHLNKIFPKVADIRSIHTCIRIDDSELIPAGYYVD